MILHEAAGCDDCIEITDHCRDVAKSHILIIPFYCFSYPLPPADLPIAIHDHRDNVSGGYAFAIYHPGTSLPQQPWAV